jgi:hypothetical protein
MLTALHEAAHAVMSLYFNDWKVSPKHRLKGKRITIEPTLEETAKDREHGLVVNGYVSLHYPAKKNASRCKAGTWFVPAHLLAGDCASELYRGEPYWPGKFHYNNETIAAAFISCIPMHRS